MVMNDKSARFIALGGLKGSPPAIEIDREDWSAFAQVALQSIMIDYSEFPIQEQARVSALVADAMMHELKNRFK